MARLLILRAEEEAERSAAALAAFGHHAIVAPIVVCEPTGTSIAPQDAQASIATSPRAFRHLRPQAGQALLGLPLFAVGEATARAARMADFMTVIEGGGHAEALVRTIAAAMEPPAPLLYLAGEPRRPVLEEALAASGYRIMTHVLYRMQPAKALPKTARDALANRSLDAVLHYSAETAALFTALVAAAGLTDEAAGPEHLCLSQAIAEKLTGMPYRPAKIARMPTETALFELVSQL